MILHTEYEMPCRLLNDGSVSERREVLRNHTEFFRENRGVPNEYASASLQKDVLDTTGMILNRQVAGSNPTASTNHKWAV